MNLRWLFLLLLCLPTALHATMVKWLVRPDYDRIDYYSESVFRCEKDGKIQLIDLEGETLLPYAVDSVTDYSDGYALVLEKAGKKYRIVGILSEQNNDYQEVAGTFFTERYSYCSEGFVSVADSKGKQGYVDVKGYPVIRCQFREARPFRKGWASVSEKEGEAHYIDPYGYTLHSNIRLTDATSFNDNGEALVGNYQKLMIINTDGEVVRNYKMKTGQTDFPVRPFDYVFDENPASFAVRHNAKQQPDARYSTFEESGKQGIKKSGSIVVLAQFDELKGLAHDRAIVRNGRQWGIVVLSNDDCSVSFEPEEIVVISRSRLPECICNVTAPRGLDNLSLLLDSGDGSERLVTLEGNQYRFTPELPVNADRLVLRAKVMSDGLLQWQGTTTLPVRRAKVELNIGKPYLTSAYANQYDEQKVKAVVTNNSSFAVEIIVKMRAELKQGSKNKELTSEAPRPILLAPGESLNCTTGFKVYEQERVRVTVTVEGEGKIYGSSEAYLDLEPFY